MRATAFLLEGRSHVRVQVQRDGYRAVSQHLRDDFGILSKLQHVGRERMPQIMKSEIRKSGLREEALIGDVESLGFHRGPFLVVKTSPFCPGTTSLGHSLPAASLCASCRVLLSPQTIGGAYLERQGPALS